MTRGFFLLIAVVSAAAMVQSGVLLETPVKITADAGSQPGAAAASASTALNLAIDQGSHEFRLTVAQRGNANEALSAQKARTGWKDGFLFIRDDCRGTGETRRAWRCVVDQVFTYVDGRGGKRLVHLGEVFAGDDCVEEARFGCALYRGTFTDIDDTLENNTLVSHADSPALLLQIHVISGEFVVDLDESWGSNQERYKAGERCLAAKPAERAVHCVEGITPRRAYLFNAALATYTRRTDQLHRIRMYARSALCDGSTESECTEALRLSALLLAEIRPGERLRPRGNVKSVPLPSGK